MTSLPASESWNSPDRATRRRPRDRQAGVLFDFVARATDAMVVFDAQTGDALQVNQRAHEIFGYTEDDLVGFSVAQLGHVSSQPLQAATSARRFRWQQRRDGTAIPVETSVSSVEVDGRRLLIATLRDVSMYLGTEAELVNRLIEVEGLLQLSTLLDAAEDLPTVLDRIVEGAARCVGAAGGTIAVLEDRELCARRLWRDGAWHPVDIRRRPDSGITGMVYRTGSTIAIDDLSGDERVDEAVARLTGARALLAAPVFGHDGQVLAVLGLHQRHDGRPFGPRDIALVEAAARHAGVAIERAQAEARLAEREAYFRALMEQSQDAVFVLDDGGRRVLDANSAAERLLGRTLADLVGDDNFDPRVDEDQASTFNVMYLLSRGVSPVRIQRRWRRTDGRVIWVENSASFVDGPHGRVVLCNVRDITERLQAEQERERLRLAAEAQAEQVEILLEITAALNAAESEDEVVRAVCERAAALCNVAVAGFGLLRSDHLLTAHLRSNGLREHCEYRSPARGSIASRVLSTRRAYRSNDLAGDPYTDHEFDAQMGFRSQLAVPVVGRDDQVLGLVTLHNKTGNAPFTGQDEALVGALATQAAVALERVRSRRDVELAAEALRLAYGERDSARQSAEQRGIALGTMVELATTVTAGGDLDAVFQSLAERVARMADFDAVILNTYDPLADTITFRSLYHRLPRTPRALAARRGRSLPARGSPIYRQLQRGGTSLVLRGGLVGAYSGRDRWARAAGVNVVAVVPLRYEGRLLGDLRFAALQDREIGPEDLRLLEALAGQVAVTVHGAQNVARIKQMREDAVFRLAAACEARDPETGAHLRHMQSLTTALARELGMSPEEAEELSLASVLHDVGKIAVPDSILWKPGRLDQDEFLIMKLHAARGEAMLDGPEFYSTARAIARHHHERWDGGGYPDGRAGADIPYQARIVAVADVYDALVSPRVYKRAWAPEQAAREILAHAGGHFDPRMVEAFEALWRRDALIDRPGGT